MLQEASGKEMETNLNLFDKQYLSLYITGLMPPKCVRSSPWKVSLYNIYSFICFITLFWTIIGTSIPAVRYSDNLDFVLEAIYVCVGFTYTFLSTTFWMMNRRGLLKCIDILEYKFVSHIENLKLGNIILDAGLKHYNKIMNTIQILFTLDMLGWLLIPITVWSLEESEEYKLMNTTSYYKYFCFKFWIPEHGTEMPLYPIIYFHHAFTAFLAFYLYMAVAIVVFSLMYHTLTHFKLLNSAFDKIDELFPLAVDLDEDVDNPEKSRLGMTSGKLMEFEHLDGKVSSNLGETTRARNVKSTKVKIEELSSNAALSNFQPNAKRVSWQNNDDGISSYIIECVRYHQELLE